MSKPKYYISTAIAYTSSRPHIGNTYEIVLADSIARYKRMEGYDVYFQTGTDEHGQKIEEKANAAGITPKEYVDNVAKIVKANWDVMNTSYDKFIRTTDDYHEKQVQKIFKKLYEQGDIYKGHYEGMYCTPCESFFTESQLVDGKCPDCGGEVKPAKEEAYFFKMSKYADRLIDYINKHPEFIQPPQRKTEMMNNFLLPGLQDLCVSRTSFKWGIPVDFDNKHVVYVWLDALTNYITGIGYDCDGNSTEQFKRDWPADLHLIGKDIIRFHTIYWPIFLMALDLPLPKQVFGHPWLLMNGGKMSKSKGNVVSPEEMIAVYGADAVRAAVLFMGPPDKEKLWNEDGLAGMYKFLNRLWRQVYDLVGAAGEDTLYQAAGKKSAKELAEELNRERHRLVGKVVEDVERNNFNTAIAAIMELSNAVGNYLRAASAEERAQDAELAAFDRELADVLVELMAPFTPHWSEELWHTPLGHDTSVHEQPWPEFDLALAAADEVELAVQINGKVKTRITVAADAAEEAIRETALEAVSKATEGKNVVKVIVIPDRLVNIVVK